MATVFLEPRSLAGGVAKSEFRVSMGQSSEFRVSSFWVLVFWVSDVDNDDDDDDMLHLLLSNLSALGPSRGIPCRICLLSDRSSRPPPAL